VSTAGDCPTEARLTSALAERKLPKQAASFALDVRGFAGGADVTLVNPAGERVVERRLMSYDCDAVADAAAVIVEAYFVELAAREAQAASAGTSGNAVGGLETPEKPPALAEPAPAPPSSPGTTVTAAAVVPAKAPPPPEPAKPSATATATRFTVALQGGIDFYPQHADVAGAGALELGVVPFDTWQFLAQAVLATSTTPVSSPYRVSRVERRAAIRAAKWFVPAFSVWAGAGASLARVELPELEGASEHGVWSPIVEGGLGVALPLGAGFGLGAELGCRVLLVREHYTVAPGSQSVGDGPRLACSLLAGPSWSGPSHK
jgi:hypothetical protein